MVNTGHKKLGICSHVAIQTIATRATRLVIKHKDMWITVVQHYTQYMFLNPDTACHGNYKSL